MAEGGGPAVGSGEGVNPWPASSYSFFLLPIYLVGTGYKNVQFRRNHNTLTKTIFFLVWPPALCTQTQRPNLLHTKAQTHSICWET